MRRGRSHLLESCERCLLNRTMALESRSASRTALTARPTFEGQPGLAHFPALHRLEQKGWLASEWGRSLRPIARLRSTIGSIRERSPSAQGRRFKELETAVSVAIAARPRNHVMPVFAKLLLAHASNSLCAQSPPPRSRRTLTSTKKSTGTSRCWWSRKRLCEVMYARRHRCPGRRRLELGSPRTGERARARYTNRLRDRKPSQVEPSVRYSVDRQDRKGLTAVVVTVTSRWEVWRDQRCFQLCRRPSSPAVIRPRPVNGVGRRYGAEARGATERS